MPVYRTVIPYRFQVTLSDGIQRIITPTGLNIPEELADELVSLAAQYQVQLRTGGTGGDVSVGYTPGRGVAQASIVDGQLVLEYTDGDTDVVGQVGYTTAGVNPRVVVIGDSIENSYSYNTTTPTSTINTFGRDWPTFAMLASDGGFQLIHNAGIGGQTTGQYLSRFDTDVNPHQPGTVVIGAAENDIQQSVPLPTIRANLEAMVDKTRRLGATPVLRTTLPHHLSNAVRQAIGAYNHWVRDYCAVNAIPCLDFWELMVDHATGQFRAEYTTDGVHPNEAGAQVLGEYAADHLRPSTPALLSLPGDPTDAGMLAPNRLFATDNAGTPTTWNAIGGTPAGVVRSMVTDPQVPGRMARIAHTGSAASCALANNSSAMNTTVAGPGDVIEVSGVVTSTGGIAVSVQATANYNDGVAKSITKLALSQITRPLTRATYRVRFPPLPTGFTNIVITLTAAAGTGTADFGYPLVRNLTRENILAA